MSDDKKEKKGIDASLDRFAQMMIGRMEAMRDTGWQKPWISTRGVGRPQNISGRPYSGSNSFFLGLYGDIKGYDIPCFLTFKQARDNGCHVLQGEKSFPVIYWDLNIKDENGRRVTTEEFNSMSRERRSQMKVTPILRQFLVFNIDQTNLKEADPEKYAGLQKKFASPEIRDVSGMYANEAIDHMVDNQQWVCPIHRAKCDNAFFSPANDCITVPVKAQFNKGNTEAEVYADGMEYYSTLLHEMAHSTGHPSRLGRLESSRFGDSKYAKEELVAELTSALVGSSLGFESRVTDNSAAYIDAWISVLKTEPRFIVSLMADVNKASNMIFEHIDKQRVILREKPCLEKNDPIGRSLPYGECPFKDTAIIKNPDGSFCVTTTYMGEQLEPKSISPAYANAFLGLKRPIERDVFNETILGALYKAEIATLRSKATREMTASLKI